MVCNQNKNKIRYKTQSITIYFNNHTDELQKSLDFVTAGNSTSQLFAIKSEDVPQADLSDFPWFSGCMLSWCHGAAQRPELSRGCRNRRVWTPPQFTIQKVPLLQKVWGKSHSQEQPWKESQPMLQSATITCWICDLWTVLRRINYLDSSSKKTEGNFFQLFRKKSRQITEAPAFERRKRSPKLRPGASNGHGGPGLRASGRPSQGQRVMFRSGEAVSWSCIIYIYIYIYVIYIYIYVIYNILYIYIVQYPWIGIWRIWSVELSMHCITMEGRKRVKQSQRACPNKMRHCSTKLLRARTLAAKNILLITDCKLQMHIMLRVIITRFKDGQQSHNPYDIDDKYQLMIRMINVQFILLASNERHVHWRKLSGTSVLQWIWCQVNRTPKRKFACKDRLCLKSHTWQQRGHVRWILALFAFEWHLRPCWTIS